MAPASHMICNMIILKAYEDYKEQVGRAGHQAGQLIFVMNALQWHVIIMIITLSH